MDNVIHESPLLLMDYLGIDFSSERFFVNKFVLDIRFFRTLPPYCDHPVSIIVSL